MALVMALLLPVAVLCLGISLVVSKGSRVWATVGILLSAFVVVCIVANGVARCSGMY